MRTFTAFCQQADGKGTIWISDVEVDGNDVEEAAEAAVEAAIKACAEEWGYDEDDVHCLGLAAGSVDIVYWDDLNCD